MTVADAKRSIEHSTNVGLQLGSFELKFDWKIFDTNNSFIIKKISCYIIIFQYMKITSRWFLVLLLLFQINKFIFPSWKNKLKCILFKIEFCGAKKIISHKREDKKILFFILIFRVSRKHKILWKVTRRKKFLSLF